jgi:hypothetical protein
VSIVVETATPRPVDQSKPTAELVSWVMAFVARNRAARDSAYKPRWDEYYRVWRGLWSAESRTRMSERSRLVSPATQTAIDIKMADLIDAILSREQWFDIPDDVADADKQDAIIARDRLREDLYKDGIVDFLSEVLLNGALYGQLSAKIVTDVKQEAQAMRVGGRLVRGYVERAAIYPVAMEPGQLVWDMSGPTKADRMLGLAHEFHLGLHAIRERQANGVYLAGDVGPGPMDMKGSTERGPPGDPAVQQEDSAFITEYHGLVPKRMMAVARAGKRDEAMNIFLEAVPEHDMVEAIVTIANEGTLLRAIPNPSVMDDRAIVSEQYDKVPNRFMGRSDAEKAYNAQKGLDTELRARADALAWINNPMMAGDMTRMAPKQDLNVWPGKFFGTRGNPSEIMQEFRFGDVNASTFQQTAEYERMVAQSTGAHDSTTLRAGVRDESSMGSGIAASGMVKRSKRTVFQVETFLNTLLRRIMWRKMQFDPQRYPQDFEFQVKGTIGILAREVEMAHLTAMLQYAPEGSPPQLVLYKSLFELSASPNKAEMVAAVDKMMQPDPQQQQLQALMQQLTVAEQQAKINKLNADAMKSMAEAGAKGAESALAELEARIKLDNQRLEEINTLIEAQFAAVAMKQTQQEDRDLDIKEAKLEIDRLKARKTSSGK